MIDTAIIFIYLFIHSFVSAAMKTQLVRLRMSRIEYYSHRSKSIARVVFIFICFHFYSVV